MTSLEEATPSAVLLQENRMEALCVWLQQWKLAQSSSQPAPWQLLPKGTAVYFLATDWLEQLWTLVSQPRSLEHLGEITNIPLNNADIRSPYSYSALREDAVPVLDYAVVPASVFGHLFASWLGESEELMQGFVVWDGAFTPKLISVPYILPCIVEAGREFYRSEVSLTSNCSVEEAKSRALQRAHLGSDDEIRVWHSSCSTTQTDLSERLSAHPDLGLVDWVQPLSRPDQPIFQALNSQVLLIEIRKKKSWWSDLNPFPESQKSVGLENIGNSCYMNAVLQCLVHSYEFSMLQTLTPELPAQPLVLEEVKRLIQALLLGKEKTYNPKGLYRAVQNCFGSLTRQQEDAQQFLAQLLDLLSPELPSPPLSLMPWFESETRQDEATWLRGSSVSTLQREILRGLQKNYMICGLCGHSSIKYTPFQTLFLSLPAVKQYQITLVHSDLLKSPTQLTIESPTPMESNECIHNIWRQVAADAGISNFLIGELRQKRFVPLGLTNIAVLSAYVVMELPPFEASISLVMVDIYSRLGQESAGDVSISTRVIAVPSQSTQDQLHSVVVSALVDIYRGFCQRKLTAQWLAPSEEVFHVLSNRSQLSLVSLDWTDCGLTPKDWRSSTDSGTCGTVGQLCSLCATKVPRFALVVVNLPKYVALSLEENCQPRTISFANFFEGNPEKSLNVTLPQMLEYTLNEKPLNEEDLVSCEACGRQAQHIEGLQICYFPRLLVIALQRARLHPSGLTKSEARIHYPLQDLDLSGYEKGTAVDSPIYDLTGVTHHSGSLLKGHYKAHALHPLSNQWFLYDDCSVSEVGKSTDVLDPKDSYLLFYTRKNTAPRPSFSSLG